MKDFYQKRKTLDPRPLLIKSFSFIDIPNSGAIAYDLGCGVGQDSFALASKGFSVKSVDVSPDAFAFMDEKFGKCDAIEQIVSPLEELNFEESAFINASLVLPFVQTDYFESVISRIKSSLQQGGIFAGNFFGPKDDWRDRLVCKSLDDIRSFFSDCEILYENENEVDRPSASGPVKHWHIIDIIAKKV